MAFSSFDFSHFGKNANKFIAWGFLLLILGVFALYYTTFTSILSVVFLGTLFFIGGVVVIIDAFTSWWGKWSSFFLDLLIGLLYLAAGVIMLKNPLGASVSITLLLGLFYLILGAVRIVWSLAVRAPSWGWGFFSGLISLLLGGLILAQWPQSGLYIIGIFIGIDLLFSGWAYLMTGFAARSLRSNI